MTSLIHGGLCIYFYITGNRSLLHHSTSVGASETQSEWCLYRGPLAPNARVAEAKTRPDRKASCHHG